MKLKALLLACAVAGFTASFALADGGHGGHGKHHEHSGTTATMTTATTTAANACAQVDLRGTLASVSSSSFTLTVAKQETGEDEDDDDDDNNAATPAVPNMVGQTVTIAVGPDTRVSFKAVGKLIGPNVGDTAKVNAQACGTPATLTATSVKAQAANAAANASSKRQEKSHK